MRAARVRAIYDARVGTSYRRRTRLLAPIAVMAGLTGCSGSPSPMGAHPKAMPSSLPVPNGSSSSLPTSEPSPSDSVPSPVFPPGVSRCTTRDLQFLVVTGPSVMNQGAFVFEVRDIADRPCWLYGYFGVSMLTSEGQVAVRTTRSTVFYEGESGPPRVTTLKPHTGALGSTNHTGHAWFDIAYELLCENNHHSPTTTWQLYLPDERQAIRIPMHEADPGGSNTRYCSLSVLPVEPEMYPEKYLDG